MPNPRLFVVVGLACAVLVGALGPGWAVPPAKPDAIHPSPSPITASPRAMPAPGGPAAPSSPRPQAVPTPGTPPSPSASNVPEGCQYEPRTVDITTAPEGTRPRTLQETLQTGLQQNPRMKVAAERAVMATAQYQEARSAKNPRLQIENTTIGQNARSVDATDLFPNGQLPAGFPDSLNVVNTVQNRAYAYVQQLITTFGRVENQIAAAFIRIAVATADADADKRKLIYDLKLAYYARLQAEATVMVSELNLQSSEQNLHDTEARFKYGLLARFDLIQAQVEVTNARIHLQDARTALDTTNVHLKALLEDREPTPIWAVPPEPVQFDDRTRLEDLQKVALARRPEMLSLRLSMDVARKILAAARADNAPSLVVNLNYHYNAGNLLLPESAGNVTLGFQWPIFDGGQRNARVKQALSSMRSLEAETALLQDNVLEQVEDAWLRLVRSRNEVKLTMEKVEFAAVFYTMARARYIRGVGTSLEMQNALRGLNEARLGVVVANNGLDRAFAALEQSLGEDFPDRHLVVTALPAGKGQAVPARALTPSSPPLAPPPSPRPAPPSTARPEGSALRPPVPAGKLPLPVPTPPRSGENQHG